MRIFPIFAPCFLTNMPLSPFSLQWAALQLLLMLELQVGFAKRCCKSVLPSKPQSLLQLGASIATAVGTGLRRGFESRCCLASRIAVVTMVCRASRLFIAASRIALDVAFCCSVAVKSVSPPHLIVPIASRTRPPASSPARQ